MIRNIAKFSRIIQRKLDFLLSQLSIKFQHNTIIIRVIMYNFIMCQYFCFFTKAHKYDDQFLNTNWSNKLFINHENSRIEVKNSNGLVLITVTDIIGTEAIKITIDPNVNDYSKYEAGSNPGTPSINHLEFCLERERVYHFYLGTNQNTFKSCFINNTKISNAHEVKNLFYNNFVLLKAINGLSIKNIRIYDNFKEIDFQKERGELSDILGEFGPPHGVIYLSGGDSMLLFYGIHQCKKNKTGGVLLLKINKYNQITGIYKYFNTCNCETGAKNLIISKNDMSYS